MRTTDLKSLKLAAGHIQSKMKYIFYDFNIITTYTWPLVRSGPSIRLAPAWMRHNLKTVSMEVTDHGNRSFACYMLLIFVSNVPASTVERCSLSQAQGCRSKSSYTFQWTFAQPKGLSIKMLR